MNCEHSEALLGRADYSLSDPFRRQLKPATRRRSARRRADRRDGQPLPLRRRRNYFLKVRMCLTSALISSSDTPSKGFMTVLPSSLRPSLMALNALSSFNSAWTLGLL